MRFSRLGLVENIVKVERALVIMVMPLRLWRGVRE